MKSNIVYEFKLKLERERNRLTAQIEKLEADGLGQSMADSLSELSVYDNHPADIGDALFERGKDTALRDNERILLKAVEHALKRIDKQQYGFCAKCGCEIALARLEAVPWAEQCLNCQQDAESYQHDETARPLEEPAFGRTFLDNDVNHSMGFDGEDCLQTVLRYGSSDSPQDAPGGHDYDNLYIDEGMHAGIVDPVDAIPDPKQQP